MTVSLTKGANVNLTKAAGPAGLTSVTLGLGWDLNTRSGGDYDLDANAVVVGEDGKVLGSDDNFIFFGHLSNSDGTVVHSGDNLTGRGEGDDERIKVNLAALPATAKKVIFTVNIYQGVERGQNFGGVGNAFIRVVNDADNTELARFDLSEDSSTDTSVIFGELYRSAEGDWKFKAVGQGYPDGLKGIARDYGVSVG